MQRSCSGDLHPVVLLALRFDASQTMIARIASCVASLPMSCDGHKHVRWNVLRRLQSRGSDDR